MYQNKTVAVVVPAYNEEKQISQVIDSMPDFVDRIVIVNDNSKDGTAEIVSGYLGLPAASKLNLSPVPEPGRTRYNFAEVVLSQQNKAEDSRFMPSRIENATPESDRVISITQLENGGVGAAIARGYKWCKDHGIDCTAVMAGDGQMDPAELESIIIPVINEGIDYVKGNRLIHKSAWLVMPKVRFLGNSILSILTKLASGYWHVSDTQTGYTAISLKALGAIRICDIYKSYGMPNDMLVRLNIAFCTLKEVEIKPIYHVGEKSKMQVLKVIPRISLLLARSFFKRLWVKYLFRDFHPLFLLYNFAFVLGFGTIPYGIKLTHLAYEHREPNPLTVLAFMFLFISSFQALLFAMWMDIQDNERLYK